MTDEQKGVVIASPSIIHDSIKREVGRVLADLPTDQKAFVRLDVQLPKGANVVFGYRDTVKQKWVVSAGGWVGKDWSTGGAGWNAGGSVTIGVLQ